MRRQAQRGLGGCDGRIKQAAQQGAGIREVGVEIGHEQFSKKQIAGLCSLSLRAQRGNP
jgi:hypothetical protein